MTQGGAAYVEIRKVGRWSYELGLYPEGSWLGLQGPRVLGLARARRRAARDLRWWDGLNNRPVVEVVGAARKPYQTVADQLSQTAMPEPNRSEAEQLLTQCGWPPGLWDDDLFGLIRRAYQDGWEACVRVVDEIQEDMEP